MARAENLGPVPKISGRLSPDFRQGSNARWQRVDWTPCPPCLQMSTKARFNAATGDLSAAEQRLGKILHQITQAKARAVECLKRAKTAGAPLPIDASLEQHAEAAASAARDAATIEGERHYWASLHAATLAQLADARASVAIAEAGAKAAHDEFWRDRFNEGARAFFERHRDELAEVYGCFARHMNVTEPELRLFFEALIDKAPGEDRAYARAVPATFKTMPAPPTSTAITGDHRAIATGAIPVDANSNARLSAIESRSAAAVAAEIQATHANAVRASQEISAAERYVRDCEMTVAETIRQFGKAKAASAEERLADARRHLEGWRDAAARAAKRASELAAELELAELEAEALTLPKVH